MMTFIYKRLICVIALFLLVACGGGGGGDGGSETPTATVNEAVVELLLNGSSNGSSATLGSVFLELDLPDGFALETQSAELVGGVVTTTVADGYVAAAYLAETSSAYGRLSLSLISAQGFNPGSLATVVRTMSDSEMLATESEFVMQSLVVTDLNGVVLPGYNLTISIQKQEVSP